VERMSNNSKMNSEESDSALNRLMKCPNRSNDPTPFGLTSGGGERAIPLGTIPAEKVGIRARNLVVNEHGEKRPLRGRSRKISGPPL